MEESGLWPWRQSLRSVNERATQSASLPQAAGVTAGLRAANIFGMAHKQGVKLVEQGRTSGQALMEPGLPFSVAVAHGTRPEAVPDASGVGVDDEDGVASCVEDDGVGGLWADAGYGQERSPQPRRLLGEEGLEVTVVLAGDMIEQRTEAAGLHAEEAGRPDLGRQLRLRDREERRQIEGARPLQVGQGELHVAPGRGLCEHGAHDTLQPRLRRPPALRPVAGEQPVEEPGHQFAAVLVVGSSCGYLAL